MNFTIPEHSVLTHHKARYCFRYQISKLRTLRDIPSGPKAELLDFRADCICTYSGDLNGRRWSNTCTLHEINNITVMQVFVLERGPNLGSDAATKESNDDKTNVIFQNCLQFRKQEPWPHPRPSRDFTYVGLRISDSVPSRFVYVTTAWRY